MEDLKLVIAKNISHLRTSNGMTQLDLAESLHYSDKAVSKWERAESVPELSTLIAIADLFEVPLDCLVREWQDSKDAPVKTEASTSRKTRNRAIITSMSILLVWFAAVFAYVLIDLISRSARVHWLAFIYAVPASMIIWLVFNSIWFNRRRNYLIISLLMWSTLAAIHITFLPFGINIFLLYALGIPGQIIIIMWSRLVFKSKK